MERKAKIQLWPRQPHKGERERLGFKITLNMFIITTRQQHIGEREILCYLLTQEAEKAYYLSFWNTCQAWVVLFFFTGPCVPCVSPGGIFGLFTVTRFMIDGWPLIIWFSQVYNPVLKRKLGRNWNINDQIESIALVLSFRIRNN